MNVQVHAFRYWKSDHDAESCEDAVASDAAQGLFAMADGVGTAAYAALWSRILVQQFIELPLLSDHPFEVAWWLRRCQAAFEEQRPPIDSLPPFAREKARLGSHSTLVTLRVLDCEGDTVHVELLAMGDSCAFVCSHATGEIHPFPIHDCSDLDLPPVCFPTRFLDFDYEFNRVHRKTITLEAGDEVILATDKVSQWLWCSGAAPLANGAEHFARMKAVGSDAAWAELVEQLRAENRMRDDDATALVIRLSGNADDVVLGVYQQPAEAIVALRREQFATAIAQQNGEQIAIAYGDGQILEPYRDVTLEEIERARQIAIGKKRVAAALSAALRKNQVATTVVGPVWSQYADVLMEDPASANLRASLASQGIDLTSHLSPSVAARVQFREAMGADDDERIAEVFDVAEAAGIQISDAERTRVSLARARLYSLNSFRSALKSGDERAIVAIYSPELAADPHITPAEEAQAKLAECCVDMDRRLRLALEADEDVQIAAAFQPELMRPWMLLSPERQSRIEQAVTAMAARRQWEEILASGEIAEIAAAATRDGLQGWPFERLSCAQQAQVTTARICVDTLKSFQAVLAGDEDEAILNTYAPILGQYSLLDAAEQERFKLAQRRSTLRRQMHSALRGGHWKSIAAAYDLVLEGDNSFSPLEWQQIKQALAAEEAKERVEQAIVAENDLQVLHSLSSNLFAQDLLTADQSGQVLAALQRIDLLWRVMSAVNNNAISELVQLQKQVDEVFLNRISALLDEQTRKRLQAALQECRKPKRTWWSGWGPS